MLQALAMFQEVSMPQAIILFIVGLVLLIKGGDWFVDGATKLAHRFKIPEIIIGATIVSIGTTLPEVMVSATDAIKGNGSIAYGNAIGSIICNTSLIAALTVAIRPTGVDRDALKMPVLFFFISAVLYAVCAYFLGYFYWWVGAILLAIFATYMTLTVRQGFAMRALEGNDISLDEAQNNKNATTVAPADNSKANKVSGLLLEIGFLLLGAGLIALGANLLVENGTIIATELGVPQTVIALTFVALGTSLPELVTAITALVKGHSSLSLGNIIGANIFNLVLVSGLSIVIKPFAVPAEKLLLGYNASLVLDIPLVFITMGILTIPTLIQKKLQRWQGILLLCIYAGFCVFQFAM